MIKRLIIIFLTTLYAFPTMGMQEFGCGEYVVHGYFHLDKQKRPYILVSEKSFSEVAIFPKVMEEEKKKLGNESFKGYFTIDIKAKGTLFEHVDLISFRMDTSPHLPEKKGEVVLNKSKKCSETFSPPPVETATY